MNAPFSEPRALDPMPPLTGAPADAPPWVVVVAHGQGRLAAELVELFRDDPRVKVVEDRRSREART